ncbi:MAG: hypothetical protein K6G15_11400 [Desulfovibrio sp.]|nr:hypothetical protein [Desulfovibrio sp.]
MPQIITFFLLLFTLLGQAGASASQKDEITAQSFAALVAACQNFLLPKAQIAQKASAGEVWLANCPSCLTPIETCVCDLPVTLLTAQTDFIHFDSTRFAIHLEHGLCYLYGSVDSTEMAAIRRKLRGTLALSFCPKDSQNGHDCQPKLLREDGTPLALPMPASDHKDCVVHVFRLAR